VVGRKRAGPDASFVLYPQLTPVQDRAFQLLALGIKVSQSGRPRI
jgi:hypothetical protein